MSQFGAAGDKDSASKTFHSQLDFLNGRLQETSDTANQFLGKFVFGGIVAVIALLNVDLVVIKAPVAVNMGNMTILLAIASVSLVISRLYFSMVAEHYRSFRVSHRKLKYKYELTLHALLCNAT